MVNWCEAWLNLKDKNNVELSLWLSRLSNTHAYCNLCAKSLKYASQGSQSFMNHSSTSDHKGVSDARFSSNQVHIAVKRKQTTIASSLTSPKSPKVIVLDPSLDDKVASAEAMWLFKVAEEDYSLRSCDNTPKLFQSMFPEDPISKRFTMSRTKASYAIGDGLGPLVAKEICQALQDSEGTFTLMFDETTTLQKRKQMDLLVRFWCERDHLVVTRYITSFFFSRAPADHIVKLIVNMMENKEYDIPWSKFCNMSSDGPNINKSIYTKLNVKLKEKGFMELLPFYPCTLHIVHNGFSKGIKELTCEVEQLAFDLHSWFKSAPCKSEDFRNLAESTEIDDKSLFLRHVNTRWLTLSPTLEKILLRWDDAKKYFLKFLPSKKEYEKTLPKNKKYLRIKESLGKKEIETLVEMKFLVNISPIFLKYLRLMQSEGPLVHFMFGEMKVILSTLMKRFMNPEIVNLCKTSKKLIDLDARDEKNHLPLEKIDFGSETRKELLKLEKEKRSKCCLVLKGALMRIVAYFQKKLPLDSQLLMCLQYLGPTKIKSSSSGQFIEKLCRLIPHVVPEREHSFIKDEWKMLQLEDLQMEWYINDADLPLRLDYFWGKVLDIRTDSGERKYSLLAKLVKSCLSLQNGNAAVERSLSDNKNTLTAERTCLNDETLIGLRLVKEHSRFAGGAHQIHTLAKDIVQSMKGAHAKFTKRKNEIAAETALQARLVEEKNEREQNNLTKIKKAEEKKTKLEEAEVSLLTDEKKVDIEHQIAERMLKEATDRMTEAIGKEDMIGIKASKEALDAAHQKFQRVKLHMEEQKKTRIMIGKKRKTVMENLVDVVKKKSVGQ